ncbi:hypothetical protein [Lacticaseibacillus sp. GG6-2]
MMIWLLATLFLAMVLAVVGLFYLLARLLTVDATARQLVHPRLTAVLAAGTQNGTGLLAYLALRRSHPIDPARDRPELRQRLKTGAVAAFAILIVTALCAILVLVSGKI